VYEHYVKIPKVAFLLRNRKQLFYQFMFGQKVLVYASCSCFYSCLKHTR